MQCEWTGKVFNVTESSFEALALEVFRFQAENNTIYRSYLAQIGIRPSSVMGLSEIPFLPISFFKTHHVNTTDFKPELIFESSGTTGQQVSKHLVKDAGFYETSFLKSFHHFYGNPDEWCILALLPSYLERKHSSLVYMTENLIQKTHHPKSGFYLSDLHNLSLTLSELEKEGKTTLLIGVSFALLDLAERYPMPLRHTTIMETGGMKGRRRELIREELHEQLQNAFGLQKIESEYGMTELLSQAYAKEKGRFQCPPWMKISLREETDPLSNSFKPGRGIINVTDLANIWSCSFIATDDAGRINEDGSFEVLGRTDSSDIRGCSLMAV